jgi:hypothetical protein
VSLDDVRAAVAAVLADFGHPDVPVGLRGDVDDLVELGLPDGGRHATRLEAADPAALLVDVAHVLQNDANFWLPGAWGEPLPRCPGHPYPADPRVVDDVACWACPTTGAVVGPIGSLRP